MSAIEQPAARSGRITACSCGGQDVGALGHEVHAAEDDVRRLGPVGRLLRQLERVAGDVGELDDLVALVVVAEDEDLVAERRLGRPRPLDQVGSLAGGRSPGQSTPRSLSGSASRPSSSSARGVGVTPRSAVIGVLLAAAGSPVRGSVCVHDVGFIRVVTDLSVATSGAGAVTPSMVPCQRQPGRLPDARGDRSRTSSGAR